MIEKPDLPDEKIVACLENDFGVGECRITFLPWGADLNTAVYRAECDREMPYFVKLRRGDFYEAAVAVPNFLSSLGIRQIIPARPTRSGQLWAKLEPYQLILYPYVEGKNGFEMNLSDAQRIEFGQALKRMHTTAIPAAITIGVGREAFSPQALETVKLFLTRIEHEFFTDPVAAEMAEFLKTKREETLEIVKRAEQLSRVLQSQSLEFILCHGDIHGWNLLISNDHRLYIVDWDTLIFAPKERDLMFVGAGLGGRGHTIEEEERLFYLGYGETQVNPVAMAYYRYERIIEDIAAFCEQIFLSDEGGEDRIMALDFLQSNFRSSGAIEVACQTDKRVGWV